MPHARPAQATRPADRHDPYRALFDAIDEGFCVVEVLLDDGGNPFDYRFLDANPAFERHTGLRGAVGRTARDLVPGLEASWFERYGRVATTRRAERFVDGARSMENRTFDVFAFPVDAPERRRVGILFTDVSVRAAAEAALEASEARYAALVAATAHVVYRVNADFTRVLEVHGADIVADVDGPRPDWLAAYVHPDDRERVRAAVAQAVASGTPYEMEHRAPRLDGSTGWMLSRAVPLRDDAGAVVEWFGTGTDVTERRAAEDRLRASEERYRTLFASIDEGFAVVEAVFEGEEPVDYRFLEANPAFQRQSGLEHPVGKTARELAPGHEDIFIRTYGRVATTGEPERFVGAAPSVGGRWFEVFAFRVGDPAARQVAILFTDVTARRSAEAALREVADRDAYLVALGDALRPLVDPAVIRAEAARLLGEHLGVSRAHYAEATGRGDELLVTEDYHVPGVGSVSGVHRLGDYGARLRAAFLGGRTMASANVAADAGIALAEQDALAAIGVAAYLAAPLLRGGKFVGLLVVHQDAPRAWTAEDATLVEETARRAWDAVERARAEAALRASEERFRTLIQRSTDAVQLVAPDGTILYSSDSVEAVLGYRPDELAGRSVAPYVHPEDAPSVGEWIAGVAAEPESVASLEYRVRHKDGSWAWVETTIANHLATPNVEAIVGNFRNVTGRKELERQKDEFVAVATHELKTPVTSIKGYAQLLRNRFRRAGDERAAALMETLDGQIDRLAALVGDLVDATKVEAGQLRLEPAPFPLDDLIDETAAALQMTTDRHRIRRDGRARVEIVADRDRLGQVLTNLLSNAIKYSPDGGDVVVATDAAADATPDDAGDGNAVTICVRDRGIGIPADEVERVFDRFYRIGGGHHSAPPGLGLGLYISAEIVRRHGGRIWAESAEGEGATFCVRLPLRIPADTNPPHESRPARA